MVRSPSVALAEKTLPFFEIIVDRPLFPFPFQASMSVSPRLVSAGPVSLLSPKDADGGYMKFTAAMSPADGVKLPKSWLDGTVAVGGLTTRGGGAASGVIVSTLGFVA